MSEYFLIVRKGAGPIFELSEDDEYFVGNNLISFVTNPLKIYETFKPQGEYVVPEFIEFPTFALSKRIVHEASLKYLYGIHLVPANLTNKNINRDYYYLHSMRQVKCVDLEKSEYDELDEDGTIWDLTKLVLDDLALTKIPLQQRLIFMMKEKALMLFHKSIVDRIMATNPINLTFIPCEHYS